MSAEQLSIAIGPVDYAAAARRRERDISWMETFQNHFPLVPVPRQHLHGTRMSHEYLRRNQRKSYMKGVNKDGQRYFNNHPVFACAVPTQGDEQYDTLLPNTPYLLALLNQHDAVRFLDKQHEVIPTRVLTASAAAEMYRYTYANSDLLSPDILADSLRLQMDATFRDFKRLTDHVPNLEPVTFAANRYGVFVRPKGV